MALDAASQAFADQLAAAKTPPMHQQSPEQARAKMAGLAQLFPPGPELPRVEWHHLDDCEQPVLVLAPDNPRGVLVWWHGGGWVTGSPAEHEQLGRHLAAATGCTVVLPGYRLAPEHRFPAALEDALEAFGWVNSRRDELTGDDEAPVIIAGDSAGGNLAAVVARHLREFGLQIAGQVLAYPVLDSDLDTASYLDPTNQVGITRETMSWMWDHYVDVADRGHPDVTPGRFGDHTDLAPAVILTAEHDVLRDEGEAYAAALQAAGVPVTHRRFDGQIHGFVQLLMLPGSADGITWIAEQVDRLLSGARR